MTMLGPEALCNTVIAYMQNNLPAKLAEVDARYSTQLDLPTMVEYRVDDPNLGRMPSGFPCMWVVVPQLSIPRWSDSYQDEQTEISVWVVLTESDPQLLARKRYRMALAVWECLRDGALSRDVPWSIIETPTLDYGPVLSDRDSMMVGDFHVSTTMFLMEQN